MIGVTIGMGEWLEVARWAAERMGQMTGIECLVVNEEMLEQHSLKLPAMAHPSWIKCFVTGLFPKEREFLVFDADIIALRAWEPEKIFRLMGGRFCAVAEENTIAVMAECANYRLPFPDWYINGGLLMFSASQQWVWEQVWQQHPEYGSWLEQTALNEVFRGSGIEVVRLPRCYNTMIHGNQNKIVEMARGGAVNLHLDSIGRADEIARIQGAIHEC